MGLSSLNSESMSYFVHPSHTVFESELINIEFTYKLYLKQSIQNTKKKNYYHKVYDQSSLNDVYRKNFKE